MGVDVVERVDFSIEPFECTGLNQSVFTRHRFDYQFWRGVFRQQKVGKYAQIFIDFPPMQKGGSFNLSAFKEELVFAKRLAHEAIPPCRR